MTIALSDSNATLSASTMARLEGISDRSETIRANARSPRTIDAYLSDWCQLQRWGEGLGIEIPDSGSLSEALPVGIVEGYLLDRSDPETPDTVTPATRGAI